MDHMQVICILKPQISAPDSGIPIVEYNGVYNVIEEGFHFGIGRFYELAEHPDHAYNVGLFIPLNSGHIATIGLIFFRHPICYN